MTGTRYLYELRTNSGYLGGVAIVFAENPEGAKAAAIKAYPEYQADFEAANIVQIPTPRCDAVIYFDDGDY